MEDNDKKDQKTLSRSNSSSSSSSDPNQNNSKDEQFFRIEHIVNHRDKEPTYDPVLKRVVKRREYLIKWLGYEEKDNSWEPYENMIVDSPKTILNYEKNLKEKRINDRKKELRIKFPELFEGESQTDIDTISQASSCDMDVDKDVTISKEDAAPKVSIKLSLNKFRNSDNSSDNLVTTLPKNIDRYNIDKVEPPGWKHPSQLIYLLREKADHKKYVRITSENLQKCDATDEMCAWLEGLLKPYIVKELRKMKEMDKSKLYKLSLASD